MWYLCVRKSTFCHFEMSHNDIFLKILRFKFAQFVKRGKEGYQEGVESWLSKMVSSEKRYPSCF